MKFQIVSDSSCDLPKERAQELGVDIVPFYVSFEEENYMKEGVDISVEDFYQMMRTGQEHSPRLRCLRFRIMSMCLKSM